MRILELYSGIGGMHYAFCESGIGGEVVAAVDINTVANTVYSFNFPKTKLLQRNIISLTASEIDQLNVDMITLSPPCQPFTRVGLKKDVDDNRCDSFLHFVNLVSQLNHNFKYLLLENVKGFENSEARKQLTDTLITMDFTFQEFILSPSQFSIPNTRHRYFLLAKRRPLSFCFEPGELLENFPFNVNESSGTSCLCHKKISKLNEKHRNLVNTDGNILCYTLNSILIDKYNNKEKYPWLFLSEKILRNKVMLADIVYSHSCHSCCFTRAYTRLIEGTGSVICSSSGLKELEEAFQESKQSFFPTEEHMTTLVNLGLRFFAPREVARLMCFPDDTFQFPETVSAKQLYKLLGNSINVHVVALLMILLTSERENYDNNT